MIAAELHPLARACVRLGLGRHREAPLVGEPPREVLALMLEALVIRVMLALFGLPRELRVGVAAAPDTRRAVMHAHRVIRDSIEQRAVVRDDDADAAKALESRDQQLARLGIKVIGRLVEHQDGRLCAERGADLPSLALSRRQRGPSRERGSVEAQLAMDSPRDAVGRARERRNLGRHRLDGLCTCPNHAARRIEIHVPRSSARVRPR